MSLRDLMTIGGHSRHLSLSLVIHTKRLKFPKNTPFQIPTTEIYVKSRDVAYRKKKPPRDILKSTALGGLL